MNASELEEDFPDLKVTPYRITSPADPRYNCIAYAVGDVNHFWYDAKVHGYYWPPGVPSADTLEGWVKVFSIHGYDEAEDDSLKPEYEKIAICANEDTPEHVARQRASGTWTSRLGKGRDIDHPTLSALEGRVFGKVVKIMKRVCRDGKRVLEQAHERHRNETYPFDPVSYHLIEHLFRNQVPADKGA